MSMCGGPTGPPNQTVANKSGRKVFCVKFQKELPGLDAAPWPGEIGQRIYENVSLQAWKLWEERQKMILNEYRLLPWQKEAQEIIAKHAFRPRDEVILRKLVSRFPAIKTFSVEQVLGGWNEVQAKHFADGAIYDQIIVKH